MKTVQLKTNKRDPKAKKASSLRTEGLIPATIYGPDTDSHSVTVCSKEFRKIAAKDYTHIFELTEDSKDPYNALIKNIQRKPVSGEVLNIEFYKLMKGHKVSIKVALTFVGTSEAVKMGSEFMTVHKEVHIRCLPRQIPDEIQVDLSLIKEDGDSITFGDLKLEEGVELLDPKGETICKAETRKTTYEEEDAIADAAAAAAAEAAAVAEAAAAASTEGAAAPAADAAAKKE